jgi:hypothetical protein
VWRIIAFVIPLSGWFYAFYAFSSQERALLHFNVSLFLVPIIGFLAALAGTLWQRRIARQALNSAQHVQM